MRKRSVYFPPFVWLTLLLAASVLGCDSGVSDPAPDTPTLVFPENGDFDQVDAVELQWNSSESALLYDLEVATTPDFSTMILDEEGLTGHYYPLYELDIGKTYYWRVRAQNDYGYSDWADRWSFKPRAQAQIPASPGLVSPADDAENQLTSIIFEWQPIAGANTYHIQVSLEENFLRRVADMEGIREPSQQIRELVPTYIYFWRVRSKNPLGYSAWSPVRRLVVEDQF